MFAHAIVCRTKINYFKEVKNQAAKGTKQRKAAAAKAAAAPADGTFAPPVRAASEYNEEIEIPTIEIKVGVPG